MDKKISRNDDSTQVKFKGKIKTVIVWSINKDCERKKDCYFVRKPRFKIK